MSSRDAMLLVVRCVVQGLLVILAMTALDPVAVALFQRLSGR